MSVQLDIGNPLHIIKKIAGGVAGVFGGSKFGKQTYIDTLKMMYDLLNKARKDGLMALEADIEEPSKSPVFSKNPNFLKNHHVCDFVCDSLRMAITGVDAFDLDQMLDLDMEVHHHDSSQPTAALGTMADSLPGLGIVAAVLGVVITSMGALGGPPEEIRKESGGCTGWNLSGDSVVLRPRRADCGQHDKDCRRRTRLPLRVAGSLMVSFLKGSAPIMAVEVARRAIPSHVRAVAFQGIEEACRGGAAAAAAAGGCRFRLVHFEYEYFSPF